MSLRRSVLDVFILAIVAQVTFAAPLDPRHHSLASPVPIADAVVTSALLRPALFTQAAYCPDAEVQKWECKACKTIGKVDMLKWAGSTSSLRSMLLTQLDFFSTDDKDTPSCQSAPQSLDIHRSSNPYNFHSPDCTRHGVEKHRRRSSRNRPQRVLVDLE